MSELHYSLITWVFEEYVEGLFYTKPKQASTDEL